MGFIRFRLRCKTKASCTARLGNRNWTSMVTTKTCKTKQVEKAKSLKQTSLARALNSGALDRVPKSGYSLYCATSLRNLDSALRGVAHKTRFKILAQRWRDLSACTRQSYCVKAKSMLQARHEQAKILGVKVRGQVTNHECWEKCKPTTDVSVKAATKNVGGMLSSDVGDVVVWSHGSANHRLKIGSGSYGDCVLGQHPQTGQNLVIKFFRSTSEMQHEKEVYNSLQNGTLLNTESRQHLFVQMLMHGLAPMPWIGLSLGADTLSGCISMEPLQPCDAKGVCAQLIMALSFLLSRHLLHLDVKPSNVVYDIRSNRVQLLDFSLALRWPVTLQAIKRLNLRTFCTAPFRPPELLPTNSPDRLCKIIGPTVDIWSVGCTLYLAITNELLFQNDEEGRLYKCLMSERGRASEKRIMFRAERLLRTLELQDVAHAKFCGGLCASSVNLMLKDGQY